MSNVTIQKRGKYYQYKFEIARVDGKRKFLSKSGFKTKSEADIKAVSKGLGHRNYDLRGNYATTILRNGVEIRDVAEVLGHKDIETTENYYISSTDETRKNATDSYENAINLDVIKEIIEYKISI